MKNDGDGLGLVSSSGFHSGDGQGKLLTMSYLENYRNRERLNKTEAAESESILLSYHQRQRSPSKSPSRSPSKSPKKMVASPKKQHLSMNGFKQESPFADMSSNMLNASAQALPNATFDAKTPNPPRQIGAGDQQTTPKRSRIPHPGRGGVTPPQSPSVFAAPKVASPLAREALGRVVEIFHGLLCLSHLQ